MFLTHAVIPVARSGEGPTNRLRHSAKFRLEHPKQDARALTPSSSHPELPRPTPVSIAFWCRMESLRMAQFRIPHFAIRASARVSASQYPQAWCTDRENNLATNSEEAPPHPDAAAPTDARKAL